jgi:hypothetical protein
MAARLGQKLLICEACSVIDAAKPKKASSETENRLALAARHRKGLIDPGHVLIITIEP